MFFYVVCLLLAGLSGYIIFSRRRYKNKKSCVPFFFEDEQLVLNSLIPYPVKITDIDHVKLEYSPTQLENLVSNYVGIHVVQKNGKRRKVQYKVNKYNPADHPVEMANRLAENKIRCIMPE